MDEVHIAQFAALLRTLSKQMQRQVIIAVHERSLFDYLSLELSPAFDGARLNLIELGRSAIGQTTSRWAPKLYVAASATAACTVFGRRQSRPYLCFTWPFKQSIHSHAKFR